MNTDTAHQVRFWGSRSTWLTLGHWRFVLLCLMLVHASCSRPNQQRAARSPNGQYVLTVPIEKNPNYRNIAVWKVTIADSSGKQLHKDEDSRFSARLNVYWVWDAANRVWLYNSDDGCVYFWELVEGHWTKTKWDYDKMKQIDRDVAPPKGLYPEYAK